MMAWIKKKWRTLTASMRAWPDYIILGTQKGGTTSVYQYLNQHPQVIPSIKREVHYFDLNYSRGPDAYRYYFPMRAGMKARSLRIGKPVLTGESSPYYLFHPHAPARIRKASKNIKLIAVLRDPIHRAFSHYTHNCRKGREERTFEAAIEQELREFSEEQKRLQADPFAESDLHRHFSYVHRGYYVDQLKRYLELFPRDAVLVIQSERLFANPRDTMNEVCRFLGLDSLPDHLEFSAHNSQRYGKRPEARCRERLRRLYRPKNRELADLLQQEFDWDGNSV